MNEKNCREGDSQKHFKIPDTTKYHILRKRQSSMTGNTIFSRRKSTT